LVLIDLSANLITSTMNSVGADPEEVAINPNTNLAVVTNETSVGVNLIQLPNPVPVLTSLSPVSVSAGGPGFTLTLNGSKFIQASTVTFNNQTMTTQFVSNNQLTATIPASAIATTGTVPVSVTNPTPGGGTSNSLLFTINNPVPVLSSITPGSTLAGSPDFKLTINGSQFLTTSTVSFNGTTLTPVFVSSSQLNVTIPTANAAAGGSYSVTVINPAPGGGTSNSITFTVNNPVPTLTALSPSSAIAGSGDILVSLTGANFVTTSTISFTGQILTLQFVSTSQVNVTIPASAMTTAGLYPMTVTNPAPGGGISNSITFTVSNPVPALTALTPNNIIAGGGSFLMTLTGTNFVATSTINFSGVALTPQFVSSNQLNVTIPASAIASAGISLVTVVNPVPGGGTSNPVTLTVNNPVPTLTTLTPGSAMAGSGSFVLALSGNNFVTTSTISFSGQILTPQFVSSSQLNITIPAATVAAVGIYNVIVSNPSPGGGISNLSPFTVNNPVPVLSALAPPSAVAGSNGFSMTLTGSNFVTISTINFSGQVLIPQFVNTNQLTATIPATLVAMAGDYSVSVLNPTPGGGASNSLIFTVNNPVPVITALSPGNINEGSGDFWLSVNGSNFVNSSTINFSSQPLATSFVSTNQIAATVPAFAVATAGNYTVKVVNPAPGGGVSNDASFTVNSVPYMNFSITSPTAGTVNQPEIMVQGSFTTNIAEYGISVNGIPAMISGNQFVANHVPLTSGANTLSVIGTSSSGQIFQKSILIGSNPVKYYVKLEAPAETGLNPLIVTLGAMTFLPSPAATTTLSFTGPVFPAVSFASTNSINVTMNTEGLYVFTLTVTDTLGNSYQDSVAINVLSLTAIDTLFKGKWNTMINALTKGDTQTAVNQIIGPNQADFQNLLNALGTQLPSILATSQSLNFISLTNNAAIYKLLTVENGMTYSYNVVFVKDLDGLWKIQEF
ncbi:MAG: hypothetical protein HY202_08600, partial [Nitrospirae bacterium]|nr:hypothetical protein [Nitrospirota bacterium]